MTISPNPSNNRTADTSIAVWAALLSALIASLGSLWLTMGMDLEAGPLCVVQRNCAMLAVGILVSGLLMRDQNAAGVAAMAIPVAVVGLTVCGVQNVLEYTGKLECPKGILDIGTATQQALVALAILVACLLLAARNRVLIAVAAVLIGVGVAWLLYMTSPKLTVPTKAYDGKPMKCRISYIDPAPPSAK